MSLSRIMITARVATPFRKDGEIDEEAFRQWLEKFVECQIGVLIGSCGSGEGGALTPAELTRLYEIGVEVCKGRVLVAANQPEQFTAKLSIEQAKAAMASGVDFTNIYGPYGLHGYRPTDQEYLAYFDHILSEIDYPVSLCPHRGVGYSPKPNIIAEIANKYPQVCMLILSGVAGDDYLVRTLEYLKRDIPIIVRYEGSFNSFGMGAVGIDVQEANIIPETVRAYVDAFEASEWQVAADLYAKLKMVTLINERWKPSSARWIKMAFRAFRLPGWEGGLRPPYLMPSEEDIAEYIATMSRVGLPEISAMLSAAQNHN